MNLCTSATVLVRVHYPITIGKNFRSDSENIKLDTGFSLRGRSKRFSRDVQRGGGPLRGYIVSYQLPVQVKLQARDLLRWRLASLAIQKYSRPIPDSNDHKLSTKEPYNNPANVKLLEWPLLLCLPISVAIYGAVIAAAWNYQFTGYSDQNLWRASSIVFLSATVYPFIYFPGYLLFLGPKKIWSKASAVSNKFVVWLFRLSSLVVGIISGTVLVGSALTYIAARIYVFVESIVDVFHLQPEVLQQPRWTEYIPHIV
jgi:hypothetical protein